jgi:hypothetical protein
LLDRAWKICSSYELLHIEILNIKELLRRNSYPSSVIEKEVEKFLNKKIPHKETVPKEDKKKVYLVLPYFNDKMEEYGERLRKLVTDYNPEIDFRLMFKCPLTISNLFSFKDKTPKLLRSLVVYRIGCKDCREFYIGKTCRCLCRRIEEHKKWKGTGENISSLFEHSITSKHQIDYDDVQILDTASNDHMLQLKEMLYINKNKPTLNKQKNSSLFSLILGKYD